MIHFLPIKSIREEDKELFGENITKLARLAHHELPVEEGLVVIAPKEQINKIFEDLNISTKEEFEMNRQKFEVKLFAIFPPGGLFEELSVKGNSNEVWRGILKGWLGIIVSKIHREGFDKKHLTALPGQVVLFATDISASGRAFYDRFKKEVLVKMEEGELSFEVGIEVDRIVVAAEKILHIPYIYNFIVDSGEVKITKVSPFTDKKIFESDVKNVNPKPKGEIKVNLNRRAVKLFLEIQSGFVTDLDVDGFIVSPGKEDSDQKAFRLSELASSFQSHPVIFSFGEVEKSEDGSFRSALEEEAKVFLYARHKKRLLNTQIALPFVNSIEEFMQVKRDLSSLGVLRKASLKFWMKVNVPENLINMENYLVGGIDGMIIDLDMMAKKLAGQEKLSVNSGVVQMIEKFIDEPLKILHKAGIPVIVAGRIVMDHQLLENLVNFGVFGVAIDGDESTHTRENIKSLEQKHQNLVS